MKENHDTETYRLITGSGKNIGRAIAQTAKDGMNLVIHGGSDLDACEQTHVKQNPWDPDSCHGRGRL